MRTKVQQQIQETVLKLEAKLVPTGPGVERHLSLPTEGWSGERVREELGKLSEMKHTEWEKGRVSGAVYHGGEELVKLQTEAFGKFTPANPIHPDVFPGVRKMEAEVVAMVRIDAVRCESVLTALAGPGSVQRTGRWSRRNNFWRHRIHTDGMLERTQQGIQRARCNGT